MTETILLTGVSGFIAKHIALAALLRGHSLRGTLRSPDRAEEVRAALRPHLPDASALDRLSFAVTDLERDEGWVRGCGLNISVRLRSITTPSHGPALCIERLRARALALLRGQQPVHGIDQGLRLLRLLGQGCVQVLQVRGQIGLPRFDLLDPRPNLRGVIPQGALYSP